MAKLVKAGKLAERPPAQGSAGVEELEVKYDCGVIPVAPLEPIAVEEGQEPPRTPVRDLLKRHKACRYEEVKLGLVQKPGETSRLYTLRPTSGLDACFDDLLELARLKGWTEQTQVRGLADGARYIRPRMAEAFHACPFRFILDRPDCKEHLSSAGAALEPFTGAPAQQWAREALVKLEGAGADEVVAELRRAYEASGKDDATRNETLRLEAGVHRAEH